MKNWLRNIQATGHISVKPTMRNIYTLKSIPKIFFQEHVFFPCYYKR